MNIYVRTLAHKVAATLIISEKFLVMSFTAIAPYLILKGLLGNLKQ